MTITVDTATRTARQRRGRRRYAAIGANVRDVGRGRRTGTETDPTGRSMRPVSQTDAPHRPETYISRDGLARLRHVRDWKHGADEAGVPRRYAWADEPKSLGNDGLLAVGASRVTLARAIALAWLDVPRDLRGDDRGGDACAVLLSADGPIVARNVGWISRSELRQTRTRLARDGTPLAHANDDASSSSGGAESDDARASSDEPSSDEDELWRPMRHVRRTARTFIDTFDPVLHGAAYVSSNGRVRTDLGPVPPCVGCDGDPVVELGPYGTVGIADAVAQTFGDGPNGVRGVANHGDASATALRLVPHEARALRPAERQVYDAFAHGATVGDIAKARGCVVSTVHTHLYRALASVELDTIGTGIWQRLVPRSVRAAVQRLYAAHDELGGTLTEFRTSVETALSGDAEWLALDDKWVALRYARLCALRTVFHGATKRALGHDSRTTSRHPNS